MMETELDTESEAESDDTAINIYEAVLNNVEYRCTHLPSLRSTTSSQHRDGGWNRYPHRSLYTKVSKLVNIFGFSFHNSAFAI